MMPAGERSSLLARAACLAAAVAITFELFHLGAQPAAAGLVPAPWDKLAHFIVYALLTALLWKATGGRLPVVVVAAVMLVGGLDELHQAGLPGRFASVGDFLVDAGAALCTGGILMALDARNARLLAGSQPAER